MIANSFGVNLQTYASQIAKANDYELDIYVLYIGGCSLSTHSYNISNDKKDYELFVNGANTGKMISIKEALLMDAWDYVSLQQASHESGNIASYYPYFEDVYNFVRKLSPKSEIIWHKTWAYSPLYSYKYDTVCDFCPTFTFKNEDQMKKGIDDCCKQICKEFNIKTVINSGDVVYQAIRDYGDVYDEQGFHMSSIGNYLIGTNLIKILSKKRITNIYVPDGLTKENCEKIVSIINNKF